MALMLAKNLVAEALETLGHGAATTEEVIDAMWVLVEEKGRFMMVFPPPQAWVPGVLRDESVFVRVPGTPPRWRLRSTV
ncbi:hypothetical protein HY631_04470 [Candidatus Uhrbacteria bacterium]|nr:hypothetical protein [Candidatus Uhrbacteria bacterium]